MKSKKWFKRSVPILAALFLVSFWAAVSGAAEEKPAPVPSLYERLGGADNIAVVVDDIIEHCYADEILHANPAIAEAHKRFPKAAYKFKVTLLASQITGGPYKYAGRTMKDAHQHLNITEKEWKELTRVIRESLNRFNVPQKEQDELIAKIESTKGEIVVSLRKQQISRR